jgi:hypothetical protein
MPEGYASLMLSRLKPWIVMILLASTVAFVLLGLQASIDGHTGLWMIGAALFQGILVAIIVWREKETPSSAWERLKQPPRRGL